MDVEILSANLMQQKKQNEASAVLAVETGKYLPSRLFGES